MMQIEFVEGGAEIRVTDVEGGALRLPRGGGRRASHPNACKRLLRLPGQGRHGLGRRHLIILVIQQLGRLSERRP